jgi:uncharacterized protein (TIRG00374 family)
MRFFKEALKYLPLGIGLTILTVGSLFVPWHEVGPYLTKLSPSSYACIVILGVAFYLVRVTRYYYMLHVLRTPRSFWRTLIAYFEAQPVSLLPGGEVYRTLTLKKQVNVSLSNGIPIVFLQSLTENVGLVFLALTSAIILKQQPILIALAAMLYIVVFIVIRTRRTAEPSRRFLNRLPFVNLARNTFHRFVTKNKILLSGTSLIILLATGLVSSSIASLLLYIIASDMGTQLSIPQAVIAFSLPAVLQNVTFLPGGIGVNEQGSVGVLTLLGASLPSAIAITIIMRTVTLLFGVVLGLGAIVTAKIHPNLTS